MLALLVRYPAFTRFWIGQVVSQVGDRIHSLALLWLVYRWTGSGFAVGAVMIASTLPAILIGPLAGNVADRWSRRSVLVVSDIVRSVVVLWLAWRAWTGVLALPDLLGATALVAVAAAFFNPAALAMVPTLVPTEELTRANALSQLSASACGVVGPIVGSGLIALIGVPLAFAVNGISFLLSALFEATIATGPAPGGARGFWEELREGWRGAMDEALVRSLLVPIAVVNFFFSAIVVLVPVLAEGVYRSGATGLGVMMSGFGVGTLAGAMTLSMAGARLRRGPLIIGGLVGIGVAFATMGSVLSMTVTVTMLALIGLALNLVNISLLTLYQSILPDAVRGKVFGLITALSLSMQPIAYGIIGALVDAMGPRPLMLASGALIAVTGLRLLGVKKLLEV